MAITPTGNVYLLTVPLTADNKNQLDFEDADKQYEYFFSCKQNQFNMDDVTYIKKDEIIYIPFHIDKLWNVNYLMYRNTNFSTKWFYAFIIGMEYENDNCTKIQIQTDVFQTWMFNYKILDSFIEREMINVADDVPGSNLLPEGLETGEFKIGGIASFDDLEPVYVIAYSGDTYTSIGGEQIISVNQNGHKYNGIYSSITFIICNSAGFNLAMRTMNAGDNSSKVITVFTIPKFAVKSLLPVDPPGQTTFFFDFIEQDFKEPPIIKTLTSLPNNIDGYTPRNQKLRTYPYIYLGFNPPNGSSKIFRYENFSNSTPSFKFISEINPNPTIGIIPQNYRGDNGDSLSDMVTLSGYPTISYKTDYFNTWLAQNSNIIDLNLKQEEYNYQIDQIKTGIQGSSSIINSALKSNIGGAIESGAMTGLNLAQADVNHEFYIKQQMAQIERQKMLPDTVNMGSSNATLLGYEYIDNNIFTRYTIKRQFAERIDKFFDMYGYLTNTVKKPNVRNRPNWNYVKTIGVNIRSGIPQEDIEVLKNIYNNGVTIWHNPSTFGDYSQNNR